MDFFIVSFISLIVATVKSLLKVNLFTLALDKPSTKTFRVPSGNLSNCKTLAVPYEPNYLYLDYLYRSFL